MKYLITGLGNIGSEYWGTRHNVGFRVVNHLVEQAGASFPDERYGAVARMRIKNCELVVLKPNTYMNLSGNAVRYWLQKENIPVENLLIVVDDLALPFGTLRLKPKGSDAGHNGLKNIAQMLNTHKTMPACVSDWEMIFQGAVKLTLCWESFHKKNSTKCPQYWIVQPKSSKVSVWRVFN